MKYIDLTNGRVLIGEGVSISCHKDAPSIYRVAAWGNDDFGMEKGFDNIFDAMDEFRSLPDQVSESLLKARGFYCA